MNGRTASKAGGRDRSAEVVAVVSIHVKPGYEEEFLRLVTPVLDAMRHEATFVNAVLHRDPDDPTRFMLYETWADLDELSRVQVHREYRKAYWARLPRLLREPRQVQIWEPLRGDFTFFRGGVAPVTGRSSPA
ncbi:MAG TPA: putative quinol monooxygenase [Thermodesulfobacteriota bacterium]